MAYLGPASTATLRRAATRALVALFAAVLTLATIVSATGASDVVSLTQDSFAKELKSGTWMVEYFAPWCPHCKKLAPKYEKLATNVATWRTTYNFHVAKVDCVAQEKLCEQEKIEGFPTIYIYHNAERKEEWDGERTYAGLLQYATETIAKYPNPPQPIHDPDEGKHKVDPQPAVGAPANAGAKPAGGKASSDSTGAAVADVQLGAELKAKQDEFTKIAETRAPTGLGKYGRVVDLDTESFGEITDGTGPWLLEFYAPWCGHCQKLEPVYEELGRRLKGKMNVARINADAESDLRTRFEIRGYPTIKLYRGGATTDYRGPRTLDALEAFALEAAQPQEVRHITYTQFQRLREEHDVLVVFAYGAKAKVEHWRAFLQAADSWILPSVTGVYASADTSFSQGTGAVVLVYRRGYDEAERYPESQQDIAPPVKEEPEGEKIVYDEESAAAERAAQIASDFTVAGVRKFVQQHQYPLLPELTDHNAVDIIDGGSAEDDDYDSEAAAQRRRRVVVLGVLDPQSDTADAVKKELATVADTVLRKHSGQMHGLTVQTVWLDGRAWSDYIRRVYSINTADLPRVVLSVASREEFYATNAEGKPFQVKSDAILAALGEVTRQLTDKSYVGSLHATSTRGAVYTWLKAGVRSASTLSPSFIVAVLGVSALGIYFLFCRKSGGYQQLESSKFD